MIRISSRFALAMMLLCLIAIPAFAQLQNNVWYFGDSVGIDFSSGTAKLLLDGKLYETGSWIQNNPGFGDASICDRWGRLQFYTSGHRAVFNRNHQLMPTINDTLGSEICVAVPMGCDTNKYVIVDNDDGWIKWDSLGNETYAYYPPRVAYSIVDMTLDGGNGGLATAPIELMRPCSDRLCVLPHANGTDSWIVNHKLYTPYYSSWHVSARGVNPTPVLSKVDSVVGYYETPEDEGIINTSPDGRHILDSWQEGIAQLLDFDPQTGKITFVKSLFPLQGGPMCFSPDNSKIYHTDYARLVQYDLATGKVTTLDSTTNSDIVNVQVAPDGKVYVCRSTSGWLGVVNNPNALGAACNYQSFGFYLGGRMTSYDGEWLPTNMNSFPDSVPAACDKVTADFTALPSCSGLCLAFFDWSNGSPTSWSWSFPGASPDAATGEQVQVCYDSAGFYPVTLIVNGPNGTDTLVKSVLVDSGSRLAACVRDPAQSVTTGAVVSVPIAMGVPHSLGLDTAQVTSINVTYQFNPNIINIDSADLATRVIPPPGWSIKSFSIDSGILIVEYANTNNLHVQDSLVLGELDFDAQAGPGSSYLSVISVVLFTTDGIINLCSDEGGNFIVQVTVSSSGVSPRTVSEIQQVSIYPNPAHGEEAIVSWSDAASVASIHIFDVLGREVWTVNDLGLLSGHEVELPLGGLTNGTYNMIADRNGARLFCKFVVSQ